MSDYKSGKAYREALRGRTRQGSNPASREVDDELGGWLPSQRGGQATPHKETVGHHPHGGFVHPTHPNAERMRAGNSGTQSDTLKYRRTDLNKVKMGR